MLRYTLNRLALGLVSILILSMIVYAAAQVLPGNPGRLVLGREATPEAVAKFNQELGYDKRSSRCTPCSCACRSASSRE